MSNAGYGNHDASKPGGASGAAGRGTPGRPGPAGTDASGSDAAAQAAVEGRPASAGRGEAPVGGGHRPVPSNDRREVATPGEGAGPGRDQAGSDVDPGTG